MRAQLSLLLVATAALASGCAEKRATQAEAQKKNEAQVRAEAARKEMETVPQAFRPRYNRRLESEVAPTKSDTPAKKP